MKATKLLCYLAVTLFLGISSCAPEALDKSMSSEELQVAPQAKLIEIEIMELINAHRIAEGLNILQQHTTVKAVAHTHTDYMIIEDDVSHDNFFERKERLEINANANVVSENVAYGFNTANAVVYAWLNSPSHKATIEGDFTDFDISAEQNSQGQWYFTNIFIQR